MVKSKNNLDIKILHADDDEAFRDQIGELLRYQGYTVDAVQDGVEAINAIQNNGYQVALLDTNMPKVNGIEVLHFI
jgi:CheY-like chemotaxis protein